MATKSAAGEGATPSRAALEQQLDQQLRLTRAIMALLRELPLRREAPFYLGPAADDLATRCIVPPIPIPRLDKAAAALAAAWDAAPDELRLRVFWVVARQLEPDRPAGHLRKALGEALPRAIEFVARHAQATRRRGAPVTQLHKRSLADALARTYWELTGRNPSWSGGVETPFARLVAAVFELAELAGSRHHGRAATERWRAARLYPQLGQKKRQLRGEDCSTEPKLKEDDAPYRGGHRGQNTRNWRDRRKVEVGGRAEDAGSASAIRPLSTEQEVSALLHLPRRH